MKTGKERGVDREISIVTSILTFYDLIKRTADELGRRNHLDKLRNYEELYDEMYQEIDIYSHGGGDDAIEPPVLIANLCRCARDPAFYDSMRTNELHRRFQTIARAAESNDEFWSYLKNSRMAPQLVNFRMKTRSFTNNALTIFKPILRAISHLASNNVRARVYNQNFRVSVSYENERSRPAVRFSDRSGQDERKFTKEQFVEFVKGNITWNFVERGPDDADGDFIIRNMFPIAISPYRINGEKLGHGHQFVLVHEKTRESEVLYIVDNIAEAEYQNYKRGEFTVDARVVIEKILGYFRLVFPGAVIPPTRRIISLSRTIETLPLKDEVGEDPLEYYSCAFIAVSNIARLHIYPSYEDLCVFDLRDYTTDKDFAIFWSCIRYQLARLFKSVVMNKLGYLVDSNLDGGEIINDFFWEIDTEDHCVRKWQFIDYRMIVATNSSRVREHGRCCAVQAHAQYSDDDYADV